MATVKVYKVRKYDINADEFRISRRMATKEGVKRMCGEAIEGSEEEIDATLLEPGEEWTPRDFSPPSGRNSNSVDR